MRHVRKRAESPPPAHFIFLALTFVLFETSSSAPIGLYDAGARADKGL